MNPVYVKCYMRYLPLEVQKPGGHAVPMGGRWPGDYMSTSDDKSG